MIVPFAIIGLLILAALAFLLNRLWAAFYVLQGKDFWYVVIGQWLERYLARNAETRETET